jgi:hypothetical protein
MNATKPIADVGDTVAVSVTVWPICGVGGVTLVRVVVVLAALRRAPKNRIPLEIAIVDRIIVCPPSELRIRWSLGNRTPYQIY